MKNKYIFFFIGTEAELIKLFPIIVECYKQKLPYKVIASGQNDINKSQIIKLIDCINVDLELSKEESIKKSVIGLLTWWLYTFSVALKQINDKFYDVQFDNSIMVVHGDTVSTFMGAKIGKKLGMRVCHVEAGLRSHNIYLHPSASVLL